jgi:large subunit ribosomal protein L9
MKVILKQDVKGLGKKEDMVEVSPGHARNYLIPRGIAVEASSDNINVMKTKKQAEKKKKEREFEKAQHMAEKIKAITLVIKAKSGENDKLFGSITGKDISEKLKKEFGIDIDKRKLELEESIKSLGPVEVNVRLYPEVIAKLKVLIEKE